MSDSSGEERALIGLFIGSGITQRGVRAQQEHRCSPVDVERLRQRMNNTRPGGSVIIFQRIVCLFWLVSTFVNAA